jgi:GxxExxY protein
MGTRIASLTCMPATTAKALNEITETIIRSAIRVHKTFGSGLLESAYVACLCHDLAAEGLKIERQKRLPLVYRGLKMSCAYRADIVVSDRVLVEVKAVEVRSPVFERQIRTYLRLGDYRVGLLLNFGLSTMKAGIDRVVNNFPDD